jgi:hypothetical protein
MHDLSDFNQQRDQLLADIEVMIAMDHGITDANGNPTAQYSFPQSSLDFGWYGSRPFQGFTLKLGVMYAQQLTDATQAP